MRGWLSFLGSWGVNGFIMEDFNADLIKTGRTDQLQSFWGPLRLGDITH
jgi:hypothetical protein